MTLCVWFSWITAEPASTLPGYDPTLSTAMWLSSTCKVRMGSLCTRWPWLAGIMFPPSDLAYRAMCSLTATLCSSCFSPKLWMGRGQATMLPDSWNSQWVYLNIVLVAWKVVWPFVLIHACLWRKKLLILPMFAFWAGITLLFSMQFPAYVCLVVYAYSFHTWLIACHKVVHGAI